MPPPGPQGGPGWTPPPKPGLIPLRPLGFGTLLGAPFQALRRNPKPTFGAALLMQLLVSVVTLAVVGGVGLLVFGRFTNLSETEQNELLPGSIASVLLASLVPVALAAVVSALLQGIVVLEVARATLGEKLTFRALWRLVRPTFGRLILWTVVVAGALVLGAAVLTGVIVLGVLAGGTGLAIAIGAAVLLLIGMVALGVWIGIKVSIVPSVLVMEKTTIGRAVRRSWTLTNGYFWRTLGVQFIVATILSIVGSVITGPLSIGFTLVGAIIDPNGTEGTLIALTIVSYVIQFVFGLLIGAVSTVVQSAAVSLIYIDLRMRKEGLDLELARFVERRAAGTATTADDPYLTRSE